MAHSHSEAVQFSSQLSLCLILLTQLTPFGHSFPLVQIPNNSTLPLQIKSFEGAQNFQNWTETNSGTLAPTSAEGELPEKVSLMGEDGDAGGFVTSSTQPISESKGPIVSMDSKSSFETSSNENSTVIQRQETLNSSSIEAKQDLSSSSTPPTTTNDPNVGIFQFLFQALSMHFLINDSPQPPKPNQTSEEQMLLNNERQVQDLIQQKSNNREEREVDVVYLSNLPNIVILEEFSTSTGTSTSADGITTEKIPNEELTAGDMETVDEGEGVRRRRNAMLTMTSGSSPRSDDTEDAASTSTPVALHQSISTKEVGVIPSAAESGEERTLIRQSTEDPSGVSSSGGQVSTLITGSHLDSSPMAAKSPASAQSTGTVGTEAQNTSNPTVFISGEDSYHTRMSNSTSNATSNSSERDTAFSRKKRQAAGSTVTPSAPSVSGTIQQIPPESFLTNTSECPSTAPPNQHVNLTSNIPTSIVATNASTSVSHSSSSVSSNVSAASISSNTSSSTTSANISTTSISQNNLPISIISTSNSTINNSGNTSGSVSSVPSNLTPSTGGYSAPAVGNSSLPGSTNQNLTVSEIPETLSVSNGSRNPYIPALNIPQNETDLTCPPTATSATGSLLPLSQSTATSTNASSPSSPALATSARTLFESSGVTQGAVANTTVSSPVPQSNATINSTVSENATALTGISATVDIAPENLEQSTKSISNMVSNASSDVTNSTSTTASSGTAIPISTGNSTVNLTMSNTQTEIISQIPTNSLSSNTTIVSANGTADQVVNSSSTSITLNSNNGNVGTVSSVSLPVAQLNSTSANAVSNSTATRALNDSTINGNIDSSGNNASTISVAAHLVSNDTSAVNSITVANNTANATLSNIQTEKIPTNNSLTSNTTIVSSSGTSGQLPNSTSTSLTLNSTIGNVGAVSSASSTSSPVAQLNSTSANVVSNSTATRALNASTINTNVDSSGNNASTISVAALLMNNGNSAVNSTTVRNNTVNSTLSNVPTEIMSQVPTNNSLTNTTTVSSNGTSDQLMNLNRTSMTVNSNVGNAGTAASASSLPVTQLNSSTAIVASNSTITSALNDSTINGNVDSSINNASNISVAGLLNNGTSGVNSTTVGNSSTVIGTSATANLIPENLEFPVSMNTVSSNSSVNASSVQVNTSTPGNNSGSTSNGTEAVASGLGIENITSSGAQIQTTSQSPTDNASASTATNGSSNATMNQSSVSSNLLGNGSVLTTNTATSMQSGNATAFDIYTPTSMNSSSIPSSVIPTPSAQLLNSGSVPPQGSNFPLNQSTIAVSGIVSQNDSELLNSTILGIQNSSLNSTGILSESSDSIDGRTLQGGDNIPSPEGLSAPADTSSSIYSEKAENQEISYTVSEAPHLFYSFQETVKTNTSTGSYRVLLPDGRTEVVTYTADGSGYHPVIEYENIKGTASA